MTLAGRLRDRFEVERAVKTITPTGTERDWQFLERRWGRLVNASTGARATYQQAGYGEVTHEMHMRGPTPYTMREHRFVLPYGVHRNVYEIVAPAINPDNIGRTWVTPVRVQKEVDVPNG